ncbi:hypothetical protein YC2023_095102 [Brassica napus]
MKPHNLKTTTTHPWASTSKVNVTRLPSHVCRCHVLVLSRTAVVLLGDYVVVLISGLYIAFGEELRWLKKSSAVYGTLNKWLAWEVEFSLLLQLRLLQILRKRSQSHRVIQVK